MNRLVFDWGESSPLVDELRKPIESVRIDFGAYHGRPERVTLWRLDNTGLSIRCDMHDVADRTEVGVLTFVSLAEFQAPEDRIPWRQKPSTAMKAQKLVINESGTSAESGFVLKSGSSELIIVAGAYPFSLAISGLVDAPHIFEPEYPIERYVRVDMC